MPMDNQAQIVQALNTVHSGTQVTAEQRHQAERICENAKESPQAALYGHHLAHQTQGYPDTARHFGLSLIENTIRYRWDDAHYSDSDRLQIRDAVVQLATEGLKPEGHELHFIKEKVAQLLTGLTERLWPQQWPELDQVLQTMYATSPTLQEISLVAIKNLADDLGPFEDPLAILRKQDLTDALICVSLSSPALQLAYPKGIKSHANKSVTVMPVLTDNVGWLVRWTTTMRDFHSKMVQPNFSLPSDSAALLRFHFDTLRTILEITHLKGLLEINWPTLLADYLELTHYPEFQKLAVELWLVLSNRHFSDAADRHDFLSQWLTPEILPRWSAIYQHYHQTRADDDSDEAACGLRLVQGTCQMIINHICHRSSRHSLPDYFSHLIELVLKMSESPNILISSQVMPVWTAAYKHKRTGEWLRAQLPLPRMLMLCINLAIQCGTVLHACNVDPEDSLLPEFDGLGLQRNYFVGIRLRALELIQQAVIINPADTLAWLYEQLRPVFARPASDRFDIEQETALYITAFVMDTPLNGLDPATESAVNQVKDGLCERLLEFSPLHEDTVTRQLQTFCNFSSVFQRNDQLLFMFLEKVFALMLQAKPEYSESPMARANGTIHNWQAFQVQRKCATTLVKLALAIPDTFLRCYPQVSEAAGRIVHNSRVPQSNKFHIYDFLLTICFHSSAPLEDKLNVSSSIINPFLTKWAELQPYCETETGFLELLGVPYLNQAQENIREPEYTLIKDRRNDLLQALSVFFVLARRTVNPRKPTESIAVVWERCLPTVLPQLLHLIHHIHGLWSRQFLTQIDPEFQAIVDMSELERRTLINNQSLGQLGKKDEAKAPSPRLGSPFQIALRALKNWLDIARETSYELLGLLVSLDNFYKVDPGLGHVSKLVFGNSAYISNYHWKQLIQHVIVPVAMDAPLAQLDSFLPGFLCPLLEFMQGKLTTEWSALVQRGLFLSTPEEQERYNTGEVEISDVTDEIVTENMLRSLTKAWTDLIVKLVNMDFVAREGSAAAAAPPTPTVTNTIEYILSHPALSVAVIRQFGMLLCLKDSICSLAAVNTVMKMSPKWVDYPHLYPVVARDLLLAAFQALNDPYHADNQEVIIGLVAVIYTTFRPVTDIPQQVLTTIPGVTAADIDAFNAKIVATGSQKEKKAVCKMFLQSIIGMDQSKWFAKRVSSTSRNMKVSPFNVHSDTVPAAHMSSSVVDLDPYFNLADIMP
ncbi:karyopherin [Dimargaris cristalligena]|nr:karyopherin [Dimargaris cristalligena]